LDQFEQVPRRAFSPVRNDKMKFAQTGPLPERRDWKSTKPLSAILISFPLNSGFAGGDTGRRGDFWLMESSLTTAPRSQRRSQYSSLSWNLAF